MGKRKVALLTATITAVATALSGAVVAATHSPNGWPYDAPGPGTGRPVVLAAVGDVACEPPGDVSPEPAAKYLCNDTRNTAQVATAGQLEAMHPDLAAILGDEQYQVGRYDDFMGSFDKTYGAFKFLQRPAPGNHEFYDYKDGEKGVNGAGYFAYYNGVRTDPKGAPLLDTDGQPVPLPDGQAAHTGQGWYSYDLGKWHLISLNDECRTQVGGCDPNGAWVTQETDWLKQDLAANHAPCTLAYWHHPSFGAQAADDGTPDDVGPEGRMSQTWWQLLYAHGADVVLNGHEHLYARFAPMNPTGNADARRGIRQFVIGTGGEGLDPLYRTASNLVTGQDHGYGVMKLTLSASGYRWDYKTVDNTYTDAGSGMCHGAA